jgi:hypothetical protein
MVASLLLLMLSQPPASACPVADEPEFGTVVTNAIQVGGGAMYAGARERRYLDALRGPGGEPLQYNRRGSRPLETNSLTILDIYEVTYPGLDKPIVLYLDAYHFDDVLRAPKGFTCAVPIGLSAPGPDLMLAGQAQLALAIEQGSTARDVPPISLDADGSSTHGVLFDRFRMHVRAARAEAAAGKPVDPKKPPLDLVRLGMVIVAYPQRCGDKPPVPPGNVEIVPAQGAVPQRTGDLATGDALARLLPGLDLPAGAMGAAFGLDRPRPTDTIRISYPEGGCGPARDVTLAMRFTNAKGIKTPMPTLPAGQPATDRPVRLQALLDLDGMAQQIVYVGGPTALTAAAIDAVRAWTAEPARLNGAPMVTPVTFQVKFGSQ